MQVRSCLIACLTALLISACSPSLSPGQKNGPAIFTPIGHAEMGNPQGNITLAEFFDYRCGYCRGAIPTLAALTQQDNNLRIIFIDYPALGRSSVLAAKASIAAAQQKQALYLAFHDALFAAPQPFTEAKILQAAQTAGLDTEQLRQAMYSPEVDAQLQRNRKLAHHLGIRAVPTFLIGDSRLAQQANSRYPVALLAGAPDIVGFSSHIQAIRSRMP